MSGKPRLLDLFCGAGGAAMGYSRAGFEVVGVDIKPQPHYPFEFHQADALRYVAEHGREFDAIHASPPCQAYSSLTEDVARARHPDLYAPTQALLIASSLPYVIENVIGAPYSSGVVLCGRMFGMEIERHRNFETSWLLFQPDHSHEGFGRPFTITGAGTKEKPKGGRAYETAHSKKPDVADFPKYMEMPWANPFEAAQAIPPAYTEWIGRQLIAALETAP
jgi:DNA (cytosine-5)-methyltransferase 1